MATLAANEPRNFVAGDETEFPVIASDIIYEGAAVGENAAGYSRPLVAGDPFQGFAVAKVDNATGAAGDKRVTVRRKGLIRLTVAGASAITANDGSKVYAADDNTFTLTAGSNSLIGVVARWDASTDCIVHFDADAVALR
ncbi:capsid cement protein [Acuticoccus mangrovi]|uniref:Uncharacterized protein n=1 Tax=Acuticoccus mangrovi TaxID=2796142 RepID=A0A934IPP7_9HYPH|nr:capsid cement protein [Acuticoccus mangrovi]MBJ3776391.1 hypothetical protein [Acuticoccus mangrovi]